METEIGATTAGPSTRFEDLDLIRTIYGHFENRDEFDWHDVIALMQREPDLERLNAHVTQKAARAS